jgi:3'-phosphoadenosine 5'-phosphosulfate sulfotransferase (PAPS reductase)/FAD synthetase
VHNPFKIEGPACISFSGGRTSAYMLRQILLAHGGTLPPDVPVCFANTGKEKEATLAFVRDCAERWSVPIVWLEFLSRAADGFRVTSFEQAERAGEPFDRLIDQKQRLPNPVERACTEELKVKTIDRYLASVGLEDADHVVGVRADEARRIPKLRARGRVLPLVDAKVRKADVHAFWRAQPFDLGLTYLDGDGNCDLCFMKDAHIVMREVRREPQRAIWWARNEARIGATFHKDRANYETMRQFALREMPLDLGEPGESLPCSCGD